MDGTETTRDALVVGGGPAGLTAGIYLRRFHRSCMVIDAGESRARWIPESNNCPGFPDGIRGTRLLERMRAQAGTVGVPIERDRVVQIAAGDSTFAVQTLGGQRWTARAIVMATGITDQLPPYPWVEKAIATHALRLCAICDAYEVTDAHIGVHGPFEDILSHAQFLSTFSSRITLLPTDDGDEDTQRTARKIGLQVLPPGELTFDGKHISHRNGHGSREAFDTVYAYFGASSAAELVVPLGVRQNKKRELEVDRHQMTAVQGIYAVGDIVGGLNQIAVAVGQAAVAACAIHDRLPDNPRAPPAAQGRARSA
ncbi:NAD(P)/FAD-dependent oxidoreductase [Tahibacter amnicola]|uniref:NAD(P)/FAD-dependent oxidoreductase n=1 Tax=Tahibacter amnicola TaxID=2976241 RepID=A0ABY6BBT4_9GAMM|nr:NAD(P)/FAD-dependent oxidoreductase [Tahibacter amnicola]UXI67021.1 NAD(P)/FAD-dependent oxidoreductase [Tahibacter amnicola]